MKTTLGFLFLFFPAPLLVHGTTWLDNTSGSANVAVANSALHEQSDDEDVPANAPNPQFYWAEEDPSSCAAVPFDPALWKAPVSRQHRGEWSLRNMSLRKFEDKSYFSINCKNGDDVYSSAIAPGKKVFSPSLAFKQLKLDGYDKPQTGPFTSSTFTAAGITGVKVVRNAGKKVEVKYLFPLNERVLDGTWRPKVVDISAAFPAGTEAMYLPLVDAMVRQLKVNDSFPWDEPHTGNYLSAVLKPMYGTWTVGLCNLDTPVAMRWTISPLDSRQVLVTVRTLVTWVKGAKRTYAVEASLKTKVVRVGMAGKAELLLEGERPGLRLRVSGEKDWFWLENIYRDSPSTLSGRLWPNGYDWDDDSRGDLVFSRSDGKPLDPRAVCSQH